MSCILSPHGGYVSEADTEPGVLNHLATHVEAADIGDGWLEFGDKTAKGVMKSMLEAAIANDNHCRCHVAINHIFHVANVLDVDVASNGRPHSIGMDDPVVVEEHGLNAMGSWSHFR